MPKLNHVAKAQKNIYVNGKEVQYESKKGKRAGEIKYKVDRTLPCDNTDTILIEKGTPYYWWQFKNCTKQISVGRPSRQQLTRSGFLISLYNIEDAINNISIDNEIEYDLNIIKEDIQNLIDETQSSLDNMPEHLQESSSSGELLHERIENLESWLSELENIEAGIDEEEIANEVKGDNEELDETELQELIQETIDERKTEIIDEIQACESGI